MHVAEPFTGRANLYADAGGLVEIDASGHPFRIRTRYPEVREPGTSFEAEYVSRAT